MSGWLDDAEYEKARRGFEGEDGCYSPRQVSVLIGIRSDTFKKSMRGGAYDHLVGEVRRDERGYRRFTLAQVESLRGWYSPEPGGASNLVLMGYGGGLASAVMVRKVVEGEWESPDAVLFVDLGWEHPETYVQVDVDEKLVLDAGVRFERIEGVKIREALLRCGELGEDSPEPPMVKVGGTLRRKSRIEGTCHEKLKSNAIHDWARRELGVPEGRQMRQWIDVWLGVTLENFREVEQRSTKSWVLNRYPLVEEGLTRRDCERFMRARGLSQPRRSSCVGCPLRSDGYFLELRRHYPELWKEVLAVDRAVRGGLNAHRHSRLYLHRSGKPMGEAVRAGQQMKLVTGSTWTPGICR